MFGGLVGLMAMGAMPSPRGVQVGSANQHQQKNQQKALHLGSIRQKGISYLYTPDRRILEALGAFLSIKEQASGPGFDFVSTQEGPRP